MPNEGVWGDFDQRMDQSEEYKKYYVRMRGFADYESSLLPAKQGEKAPMIAVGMHHDLIPVEGQEWRAGLTCLKASQNEPCPICMAISFGIANKLVSRDDPFIAGTGMKAGTRGTRGIKSRRYALARMVLWKYQMNAGWQGDPYVFEEFPVWRVVLLQRAVAMKIKALWLDEEKFGPKVVADFDQSHPLYISGSNKNSAHWDISVTLNARPIPLGFRNQDHWDLWCSYDQAWPRNVKAEDLLKRIEENQKAMPPWFIEAIQGSQEVGLAEIPSPPCGKEANKALPPVDKVSELPG